MTTESRGGREPEATARAPCTDVSQTACGLARSPILMIGVSSGVTSSTRRRRAKLGRSCVRLVSGCQRVPR